MEQAGKKIIVDSFAAGVEFDRTKVGQDGNGQEVP